MTADDFTNIDTSKWPASPAAENGQIPVRPTTQDVLDRLLERDPAEHVVVLAIGGRQVRGIAEFVTEDDRDAEIAFVVEDAFQGRGIGRRLVHRLEQLARERGIVAFTGDMAYGNTRAAALLRGTGQRLQMLGGNGTLRFRLPLEPRLEARSGFRSAA